MNHGTGKVDHYKSIPVEIPGPLQPMVPGFLNRRREELTQFKAHIGKNDMAAIKSMAHKWKGHGTAYGFEAISLIGKDIEVAAEAKDAASVQALFFDLEEMVEFYIAKFG